MARAELRMSILIDLHILLIDKLLAKEGFNRGRLVDLSNRVVKLGSIKVLLTIRERTAWNAKSVQPDRIDQMSM